MMGTHGLMVAVVPALLLLENLHFSPEHLSFETIVRPRRRRYGHCDTANSAIPFHADPPIDGQLKWRRVRKQKHRRLFEQKR